MQRFLPGTYRTLLLVSVLLVAMFLVFQLFRNLKNTERSNEWVEHTYNVLLESDRLSAALRDCEIGQLRFIMSGIEQRLGLYQTALVEIPKAQQELRRLVMDNPAQQRRLEEADRLIALRLKVLAKRIEVRRSQGKAQAEALFESDGGLIAGRQLRLLLAEVTAQEQLLLQQRKSAAVAQSHQTFRLALVGSVLLLVLLTCANYVLERDVILRRRAEGEVRSSEVLFRGMFDNASVGITLLSGSGQFQLVNSRFCEITGYTREELLGRTFHSITLPEDLPPFDLDSSEEPPGTAGHSNKKRCIRGNGSITWVNLTASRLPRSNGDDERFICIIEDINAQAQAEAALYAANLSLVRSNESLQQFAYVASHDLQEPLRTVSMFSQLLGREYKDKLDERGEGFLNIIADGARRMSQLIEALLAYSHASSDDRQSHKYVSLEDLLQEALESLRARIDEEKAVITSDKLPVVYGDPVRLYQVFQNLIGNALKYRRPEEAPQIHVGCERLKSEWIFRIKDNGMGFPPQAAERIFGIFKRLHGQEIAGTGVGLAVVKAVIERRGGRIWAESEGEGKGATFSFTIPISAA
jgi:PAS domain S-box-containing protein